MFDCGDKWMNYFNTDNVYVMYLLGKLNHKDEDKWK